MRLVLDTNVVVSALLWNGSPRQLMALGRGSGVKVFSRIPLLAELTVAVVVPKPVPRMCLIQMMM
jgi:predicted nucleic acid-binding protein